MELLEKIERSGKELSATLLRAIGAERDQRKSKLSMQGVTLLSRALQPRTNPDGTVKIPSMFDPEVRALSVAISPFVPQETIKNLIDAASAEMKARTQTLGAGEQLVYIDPVTGQAKPISGQMPYRPDETMTEQEMFLKDPVKWKEMQKYKHEFPTYGDRSASTKTMEAIRLRSATRYTELRDKLLKESPGITAADLQKKLDEDPMLASDQAYIQKFGYSQKEDPFMAMIQSMLDKLNPGDGGGGGNEDKNPKPEKNPYRVP